MKTRMLILGLSSCALMIASSQAQGFTMNAATPMPVLQEPRLDPELREQHPHLEAVRRGCEVVEPDHAE